jgi:hypothetical protein
MAIVSPSPVSLQYGYDQNVTIDSTTFYTIEGAYINISGILSGAKDFAANQDNLLFLTDNFNLNDKVADYIEVDRTNVITNTTISFLSGSTPLYLAVSSTNITYTSNISSATVFTLDQTSSGTVFFTNVDSNLCITRTGSTTLGVQTYTGASTQLFNVTLFNDKAVIFTNYSTLFNVYTGINIVGLVPYLDTNFSSVQTFYLNRFYYNTIPNKGESNLAKYVTTPNDLTISTATKALCSNYLISTPYTTLDTTIDYANVNITPLKNYYSAEGIQTPTLSTQLRNYNKLYTGLNTTDGNDKIYLSYKGSEIAKIFVKDRDTYFHFPVSATSLALSASTLVKTGALGGSSPYRSDRLFVKKANYRKYTNWGNNPGVQNGVYFCSWLSASPASGEAVWMDRYYDPAHINLTSVLTSTAVTSAANNRPNLIWDTPSTQTFNPESLYVYHRIGPEDNKTVVDALSSSLTRFYKNWTTPLINEATGLSAGIIKNFATSAVEIFQGTNQESIDTSVCYGVSDYTDSELNYPGVTLAAYAYNTNWGNVQGSQIVGNYYSGGIGITKNNTLLTPFLSIARNTVTTTNTNLVTLKSTPTDLTNKNFILKAEYDSSYYIVTENKQILVYDQDDLIANSYSISISGDIFGANLIQENSKKQILVFASPAASSFVWRKYNIDGTLSTTGTISGTQSGYNNYGIDLNGIPYYFNGTVGNSVVDSNNTRFTLADNILSRQPYSGTTSSILSAVSGEYIACDHENNIWLLYAKRNLCKLDNYGTLIWDVYLTNAPVASGVEDVVDSKPRIITFVSEISQVTGATVHYGVVIDPKTQKLFKIDSTTGDIVTTVNLTDSSNVTLGDPTGYDYQRKYIYNAESDNDLSIKAFVRNIATENSTGSAINLNYDVSYLTPGWHHFAATLDNNNTLKFYIDGNVVKSTQVGSASSIYRIYNNKNNPDLIIGSASFKKQTLAEYTGLDVYNFKGKIADVRHYTQALQQSDIKAIQKQFLKSSFTDLKWSVPTGERYYLEQIERFFLHRLPGAKSNMFNIKIKNSNITNTAVRQIIEKNIIASLSKVVPVHTQLNNIIWE